jgi:hypothetical protein
MQLQSMLYNTQLHLFFLCTTAHCPLDSIETKDCGSFVLLCLIPFLFLLLNFETLHSIVLTPLFQNPPALLGLIVDCYLSPLC